MGTLPNQSDAQRLAAWLVTQRIDAITEPEGPAWVIWVREEDHLPQAREALAHFQSHPQDQRYRGAESTAEEIRRAAARQREKARGNVVEMRGKWAGGPGGVARRCPLVLALIAICILVGLATQTLGRGRPSLAVLYQLTFVSPPASDVWANIRQGEIWRLITPIFLHFGLTHLAFNMLALWSLGGQLENRRGTRYMLLLVLALAVLSNVGQAIEASLTGGGLMFGGMSGVVYGIFGYLLIKIRFDNRDHYQMSQGTIFLGIAWFVLCLVRSFPEGERILAFIPPIANSAHTVGLFAGMAIAYAPLVFPRSQA
ncbi:MAG: rhomboid family intramembrane serine protease [Pirellulaceae bacterium]